MSIKRILIPLPAAAGSTSEFGAALSAAKAVGAHVEALFIDQPGLQAATYGQMAHPSRTAAAAPNLYADTNGKAAHAARVRFEQACSLAGIPLLPPDTVSTVFPSATWRELQGPYVSVAGRRAAAFDLMIAASASVMEALRQIAEHSVLHVRRPVLLAPRHEPIKLDSAMIAWDESPECWHAVSAAISFLQKAKQVIVVSVDGDVKRRARSQAEVLAYLACHGIAATARVVVPDLNSIGAALLAIAAEHEVGLLVMGAYSHSRLREMLFGGATRHILQNASSRSVLLAH
ncbi:MAG TPA: universal stress protein [Pseudolabrys sp.]|nr:universal stress protein [Pseudolabrys sp.]